MKLRSLLLTFTLLLSPLSLLADDHDHHLDANEKLGTVSFPTSCSASVQKSFERGVALLHSFEYDVAGHQFEEVAQQDPQCLPVECGKGDELTRKKWLVWRHGLGKDRFAGEWNSVTLSTGLRRRLRKQLSSRRLRRLSG